MTARKVQNVKPVKFCTGFIVRTFLASVTQSAETLICFKKVSCFRHVVSSSFKVLVKTSGFPLHSFIR